MAQVTGSGCGLCGKQGKVGKCKGHRAGFVGSRDFTDMELVRAEVAKVPAKWTLVSGGARGVDQVAAALAKRQGLKVDIMPALWEQDGKSAGFKRNERLVPTLDCLIAFWDGESRGTKHAIDLGTKLLGPKLVRVIRPQLAQPGKSEQLHREAQQRQEHSQQSQQQHDWLEFSQADREAQLEAGATNSRDILDDELELERWRRDDKLHPVLSGLYQGHYDKLGTWQPAGWDDPLELDDDMLKDWEELTNEQLHTADYLMNYNGQNDFVLSLGEQLRTKRFLGSTVNPATGMSQWDWAIATYHKHHRAAA